MLDEKKKRTPRRPGAYNPKKPFITVEGIKSKPWKKLTPNDVFVLIEFYRKFNGFNKDNLSLTYKEEKKKMAPATLLKSKWRLIGYGFLYPTRWGRGRKEPSLYGLSHNWKTLNRDPELLFIQERRLAQHEKLLRKKSSKEKLEEIRILRNKLWKIEK